MPGTILSRRSDLARVLADLDAGGFGAAAFDLLARGLLPASLLLVARGRPDAGWRLALVTQVLVLVRGAFAARRLEAELRRAWSRLLDAAVRHPLGFLRLRATGRESPRLVHAALRSAQVRASTAPRLVADGVGVALLALAVVVLVGPRALGVGLGGALLALPLFVVATGRIRRAERDGFEAVESLIAEAGLLIDGAFEVRAHGAVEGLRSRADDQAAQAAGARRIVTRYRSLLGLVPAALAVVAASSPPVVRLLQSGASLATVALLGGSALAFLTSLLGALEEVAASAPQREQLARFLTTPSRQENARTEALALDRGWLRSRALTLDAVSVRHDPNPIDTPHAFSLRWDTSRGLALVGPNGAGKSTLVSALLGLVPLRSGKIRFGDEPWTEARMAALREQLAVVPQRPYTAPSRTLRWHLRLFSPEANDEALLAAIDTLELRARLEPRAPGAVLDLRAGELSGGELARLHLARLCLPRNGRQPELIVVDEPEAGLDSAGRRLVRELLAELTRTSAVIVIAHDASVVPESFQRAECEPGC